MDLDLEADQALCDLVQNLNPNPSPARPFDGVSVTSLVSVEMTFGERQWLDFARDRLPRYIALAREQKQTMHEQADSIRDGAVRETSERRRADKAEQRIAELEAELAALKSRDASAAARLNELMLSEAAGRRTNP